MRPDPSALVLEALRHKAEHGLAGAVDSRDLARGDGWIAQDVVCSSGPRDPAFEERHDWVSVAVVLSGTFTYRNDFGRNLLTPGSLLLGDAGGCFTCGHQHGEGDRCLAFHFEPAFFEQLAANAGAREPRFGRTSLPAVRALAPLVARAVVAADGTAVVSPRAPGPVVPAAAQDWAAAMANPRTSGPPVPAVARAGAVAVASPRASNSDTAAIAKKPGATAVAATPNSTSPNPALDELALDLAAGALLQSTSAKPREISPRDERRVAAVIRHLETRYHQPWALADLAGLADISPFHFLRVFRATAGQTPHQYLLRARLRAAAVTLATTPTPVTEVALASGFEDLSNFIRSFRAEFGVAPTGYRPSARRRTSW